MIQLYKNIKKLRQERKLSQEQLALMTGYSDRSSIAKIEQGIVDLPQSKIIEFANALGVTAGELMGDVDNHERKLSQRDKALLYYYNMMTDKQKDSTEQYMKFILNQDEKKGE